MYNFKEIEEKARKLLKKEDIRKAVKEDKSRKRTFSFLEGPPTANAPPALHHLELRTFKDIINKFRYMQGYDVPRKAGWDCHGLPVEVQIEKEIGLNTKKDILRYGVEKFIRRCRESVFSHIQEWNKSTEKLGYWIDLENPYITLTNQYIESVWWSLKEIYNKKLLYEAHKVVPFCPRCETPLSSHEVALGYKNIVEDSIVVKFKLKSEEYLLVWTTTPWTLPSNLAIVVNEKLDYVFVQGKEVYIIAKDLAEKFFKNPRIIKTVKGKELLGKKYEPLFSYFDNKDAFRIIAGDFVTTEEGTGIVHLAPAFGEVDYDACKAEGLPFVQPVDENGKFTSEVSEYEGMFVKDADKDIIKRLEEKNRLFKIIKYQHDYPFCWRCDTPLIYYAIKSWFIKVSQYKQKLIELNKKINWIPKHIKEGRFGDWLENVKDWALSRKKFWGTPVPIWKCECGNEEIIGSINELKKKSIKKMADKDIDLHKPFIDTIKLKCKCGKEMSRVGDVIDCWYDSGAAIFAQFHYPFENKEVFKKRFPYDFIAEGIDQTRGWFYTLHVLATLLFKDLAYKNVICAGLVVDEKGEKMSKSKGNIIFPDEVFNSVGVDATRLQFCIVDVGEPKRFGINMVKEDVLPFLDILWNTYQYHKQINNNKKAETGIEDKWILSKLNSTIREATENLENYYIDKALKPMINFVVNDFSRTYIKIVRDREDVNVKKVIGEILKKISLLLAPYAPNITEVIYREFWKQSVHLATWPEYDEEKIDKKLEQNMQKAFEIIELGLAKRNEARIGIRWPLSRATINTEKEIGKELQEIIAKQLNVKQVEIKKSKEEKVKIDTKITPELETEGYAREICRRIQEARKRAGMQKGQKIELVLQMQPKMQERLEKQVSLIQERVSALQLKLANPDDKITGYNFQSEVEIKDKKIKINFNVVNPKNERKV